MRVRLATVEDVPTLIALGRRMHEESPRFARFPFIEEKVRELCARVIAGPGAIALVAEEGETIVGMVAAIAVEHWFSTALLASDLVVYVRPESRGGRAFFALMRHLRLWADAIGCAELQVGVSTEVHAEASAAMLERLGFRRSMYGMVADV